MINVYIPKNRGKDTRYGDSQIVYDDLGYCVVIDGGCDTLATDTVAFLKAKGLKHLTLIVTHWHADHYEGARAVLDSAHTIVDEIICYNPSEVSSKISRSEASAATSFIKRAQALKKKITYLPAGKTTDKTVGEIRMKLYRVKCHGAVNAETSANNTSIAVYFQDFQKFTSGDTIEDTSACLNAFGTVKVFKIPHHGNACNRTMTAKFKSKGASICWYNDTDNIDKSGFLSTGAKRCKEAGLTVYNTSAAIEITATGGKLTVRQNGASKTVSVPYTEKAGWAKDVNAAWKYREADGNFIQNGWKHLDAWYYFENGHCVSNGWKQIDYKGAKHWFYFANGCRMQTGWVKSGNYWYYLDPATGVMMTGWIKYDERLFYLEENTANTLGHAYNSCTAQIEGKSYTFDADGVATLISEGEPKADQKEEKKEEPAAVTELKRMNGIDIASYQAGLDLRKLGKDTHFVIIKATQGTSYKNPCFEKHWKQAIEAGLLPGVYCYSSGLGAEPEADYFVAVVGPDRIGEAVLVLDWESNQNPKFGKIDVSYVRTFCGRVHELTGVWPIVYMSKSVCRAHDWSYVSKNCALWSAQYASMNAVHGYQTSPWTDSKGFGKGWTYDAIRQYTSRLKLSGYAGYLDGDMAMFGPTAWKKFAKGDRT